MKILPVIHIKTGTHALSQAKLAIQLGCDGVFLINHHGNDVITLAVASILSLEHPDLVIGVNLLSKKALDVIPLAQASGIRHVWLDYAGIHSSCADHPLQQELKAQSISSGITIYAGVAFKYQRSEPNPISATLQAMEQQFIPTTSGAGTGMAAEIEKIQSMSRVCSGELAVASGLTPKNIQLFAPFISHALVSTGISTPDDEIDPELLKAFISNARNA